MEGPSGPPAPIADSEEDDMALANSDVLTRDELLKRRSQRLSQLAKIYRDHYWALMEDLRLKHREYYWKYGKSPLKEDDEGEERENTVMVDIDGRSNGNHQNGYGDGDGESSSGKLGLGFDGSINKCAVNGCSTKAMALTNYCHAHIMSDSKQTLYKGCKYAFKSSSDTDQGAILCGKPILRSMIPSLCPGHAQKSEKAIRQLFRKGGLSVSMSMKLGSKFPCVITEYVRLIQSRRRAAARKASTDNRSNPSTSTMKDKTS